MAYAVTYLQNSECAGWTKNPIFSYMKEKTLYYIIFVHHNGVGQAIKLSLSSFLQVNIQYLHEFERRNDIKKKIAYKTVDGSDNKIQIIIILVKLSVILKIATSKCTVIDYCNKYLNTTKKLSKCFSNIRYLKNYDFFCINLKNNYMKHIR